MDHLARVRPLGACAPCEALLPRGFTVRRTTVRKERLGDILDRHAANREVDFLKIDVEGAELQVLESLDLRRHRPKIVLVEAVAPLEFHDTSVEWQPLLIDNGYSAAGFDGINRFYVRDDQQHLIPALEYPLSVLDRYVPHDAQWRRDSSIHGSRPIQREPENEADLRRQLEALQPPFRGASPGHCARYVEFNSVRGESVVFMPTAMSVGGGRGVALEHACAERLRVAASVIANAELTRMGDGLSIDDSIAELEAAIAASAHPPEALAWLALTSVTGRYPDGQAVDSLTRRTRSAEPGAIREYLAALLEETRAAGSATTAGLDVVRDQVVVFSESVVLTDLLTGIQRVAREAISRWLAQD